MTDLTIHRLNYIGSKFQLLEWLEQSIRDKTGITDFKGIRFADLFAGTGIVSHYFRLKKAIVSSNDAELYSAIISKAFALSVYTTKCNEFIQTIHQDLLEKKHEQAVPGFITKNYSPFESCERMFFTVDNAKRIDYIRSRIEAAKATLTDNEYTFLLASLILSADSVSNVPAVYGCYLKKFKAKAEKQLTLKPIHDNILTAHKNSQAFNKDVLSEDLLSAVEVDIAYLDPPYNERQYSKNYFPLNMIALTAEQQVAEKPLKGKTGIPESCFLSPFCKKSAVEDAFKKLVGGLKAKWIFLSYNSESLLGKEKMLELLGAFGVVTVIERPYKRFKSFEYNQDVEIKEFLFCLNKTSP